MAQSPRLAAYNRALVPRAQGRSGLAPWLISQDAVSVLRDLTASIRGVRPLARSVSLIKSLTIPEFRFCRAARSLLAMMEEKYCLCRRELFRF
ncbi:MAG TPA: hypothetical protein VF797_14230 [Noviherbaspirillum sp.]